jgi:hypothetical protein
VAAVIGVPAAVAQAPHGIQTGGSVIGGVVPVLGSAGQVQPAISNGDPPLIWHGGPVMHTNKVYAIFWQPPGHSLTTNYKNVIKQYFKDVAAASGQTTNVYFAATQYFDSKGNVTYSSSWGGAVVDKNPLPANGCTDPDTSICLTDTQLVAEINNQIAAKGWKRTATHQFFLFTPKGVGSCFGTSPSSGCYLTDYCAYHGSAGGGLIYANMPYADVSGCTEGEYPNGDPADSTINVTSHEHNEAITDPRLNAWYDAIGFENGDECAWLFGPLTGPAGAKYNQTINGHHYFLQMEWSNHSNNCVQTGT